MYYLHVCNLELRDRMTDAVERCPLCNGEELSLCERLDVSAIKEHYASTGLDVDYLFHDTDNLNCFECLKCHLKFYSPTILGDSKYYSHLQREDWYFLHEDKTEYEFSRKYVDKSTKVLDVGSGRGVFSKYIDCAYYQGLDLSRKAVDLAAKNNINVIDEDIKEHAEKRTEFYDLVVLFQVLEHVSDVRSFMRSSLKCLKPGGKLIIAVPNNDSFIKYAANNFLNMPPHHQLLWNQASLITLGEIYNLRVVEVFKEKVTNVHKEWFYQVLKEKSLLDFLGMDFHKIKPKKNTLKFRGEIFYKMSRDIGKAF